MRKFFLIVLNIFIITSCKSESKKVPEENTVEVDSKEEVILKEAIKEELIKIVVIADSTRSVEDYKNNINEVSKIITSSGEIASKYIESIIPINEKEYLYFYSLSYPDNNNDLYFSLNDLIFENAFEDKENCLKMYANIAELVDGEYADSYFDKIYKVASKNVEKFCEIYHSLSKDSKRRLADIYNEICVETRN